MTRVPLHVSAEAVADVGSLPAPVVGPALSAGADAGPVRFEANGSLFPSVREVVATGPERGGNISLVAGGVRGCYLVQFPRWEGGPCAAFEVGRLRAAGFGARRSLSTEDELWLAGRLGVTARVPVVGPLGLRFGLEGLLPVTKPQFVLEGLDEVVHRPSDVGVRVYLGVQALFR